MSNRRWERYMLLDPDGIPILIEDTEDDAWRIGLGWPDGAEIECAKAAGFICVKVIVQEEV